MQDVDILMHTASPFQLAAPKYENDLIRPAVDGTMRALRAAEKVGIKRFVLTSSFAAIMMAELPKDRKIYDETDWSDPDSATIDPIPNPKQWLNRRRGILCATKPRKWR